MTNLSIEIKARRNRLIELLKEREHHARKFEHHHGQILGAKYKLTQNWALSRKENAMFLYNQIWAYYHDKRIKNIDNETRANFGYEYNNSFDESYQGANYA